MGFSEHCSTCRRLEFHECHLIRNHQTLSWAWSVKFTSPNHISLSTLIILPFNLHLGLNIHRFQTFQIKFLFCLHFQTYSWVLRVKSSIAVMSHFVVSIFIFFFFFSLPSYCSLEMRQQLSHSDREHIPINTAQHTHSSYTTALQFRSPNIPNCNVISWFWQPALFRVFKVTTAWNDTYSGLQCRVTAVADTVTCRKVARSDFRGRNLWFLVFFWPFLLSYMSDVNSPPSPIFSCVFYPLLQGKWTETFANTLTQEK